MTWQLYVAFILATTLLMVIPGPNVALIVANSVGHGTRYGLITVAGTSSAMVVQLTLVGLGLGELLGHMGVWLEGVRWVGVAYLIYLGLRQLVARPAELDIRPEGRSARRIYARGMFVSLTNPKTLFFYGAFFPQFLTPGGNSAGQILLLAGAFLLVALIVDSMWALLAGRARWLLARRGRWRNRLSGGLLLGAGVGLALVRRR